MLQSRDRSIKNIKITIRKDEIFIRIEKCSKKIKRFVQISLDNNQAILVLYNLDNAKKNQERIIYISM